MKKGEVLPPLSKTPPEKLYMKVLRSTNYESTNNYKRRMKC